MAGRKRFKVDLKYDPIAYIRENGNAYHKLELFLAVRERGKEDIGGLVEEIKSLQNSDGSWPWRWQRNNLGGLIETTNAIRTLLRLGIREVKQAISFILSAQTEDGGWSENPRLRGYIPEGWVFWRTDCSSAFFTGEALCALILSGYRENSATKKGINFLRETQNEDGGWPLNNDPKYTKTDAICTNSAIKALITNGGKRNSPILKRALEAVNSHFEAWMKSVYNESEPWFAATIFETFLMLHPRSVHIKELKDYLVRLQKQDGGWGWRENPSDLTKP